MKRKFLRKVSAGFLVLSILSGQVGMVGAVIGQNNAQASEISQTVADGASATMRSARTKAAANEPKKSDLSGPRKKVGTDLLKLIDSSYLLPGESREDTVVRMKKLKQYVAKTDSSRTKLKRKTAGRDDLVYVYVQLNEGIATSVIDSSVWEVTGRDENSHLAVAFAEVSKLETLAALPQVKSVRTVTPPRVRKGSVTAEGDIVHNTAAVRTAYAQQGAGTKIGVISDGVDSMAQAKSSGDLPSTVNVLSNVSGGDEGTAMLEIIYDMAPGASLYFHDNGEDMIGFNQAVDALVAAGCKIIIDDLGYDEEAFFENGVIGSHLASVMDSQDVVFVSAAGNEADVHYQGTYYNDGYDSHDFSRGSSSNKYMYVTVPSGEYLDVVLQWNDKFGQSGNDYDLALYNRSTGAKLAESEDTQDGSGDPLEIIYYTNETSSEQQVVIDVSDYDTTSAKILELYIYPYGGELASTNVVAADSIYGHPAVPGVMAVAAIDAEDSGHDTIEYYSSRGPVTIIGETPRAKPDITALDNVSVTGVGDFGSPFAGTSASAPAIGAIISQLWGAFPTLKGTQIRDAVLNSAVDLGSSGFDTSFGYGRADASRAYQLLLAATPKSSAKDIGSFLLGGQVGVINEANRTITVTLEAGANVTMLAPNMYISPLATVSPASGTPTNFTNPVTFTVTAEDGSTKTYVVTVIRGAAKSSAKAISSFTLAGVAGTINESNHTIAVTLPAGTSVTSLSPNISISALATVSPASGSARNFTSPVTYTVTAEDGSTQNYTVTVTVSSATNNDTTPPVITLNGNSSVTLPVGTVYNEYGASAIDGIDGAVSVMITGSVNGNAVGTYTVIYSATDLSGNIATATRVVQIVNGTPTNTEKAITSFRFAGLNPAVNGIIDETNHKILLTVPYGTNVTALVPTITISNGASISPQSATAQNFSVAKVYTVTSSTGATQAYTVTVKIDASAADTLTASNAPLTISPAQKGVLIQTLINSNKVQAEIPKGGVTSNTTFTIQQETLATNDVPNVAGAKLYSGLAFNIEGVDTNQVYLGSLENDMTVTLTVPNMTKNTAGLKIYYYDEARKNWVPVTGVTFGTNTITFIADYLATFAVFQVNVDLPAGIIDGDIIQCKNSANPFAVYIVKIVGHNAYIRHIVSLQIFNYYKHLKWENLKQVGSLDAFSLSGWVRVNTGTNGQPRSSDKVWEINGDQTRHWINMTAQQFLTHGGSDEAIYTVNQGELNLYTQGPDVMSLQ